MKTIRMFQVALLMLTGVLAGCAVDQTDIKGINLVSLDEEKQLGAKFMPEVEKKYPVLNDQEVQKYVTSVGQRLLSGAREVEFTYTFKVVKDDSINAFAIPGGHIYVNTGLIKAADNEDELAGVMAHEISHAVARHGTRQMTQEYGYSLILQLLLGNNANLLGQLAVSLGTMSYSRSMENQADYLGVETMYKAGYNPQGMLTFFAKLEKLEGQKPGSITKFFSSHPLTSERLQRVQAEVSKLPRRSYTADGGSFKRIQTRLK